MKKTLNNILKTFIIVLILSSTYSLEAQDPPPPPGGDSGTGNNSDNSQGAPIGGGLLILLSLGAAYGGYKGFKLYKTRKKNLADWSLFKSNYIYLSPEKIKEELQNFRHQNLR